MYGPALRYLSLYTPPYFPLSDNLKFMSDKDWKRPQQQREIKAGLKQLFEEINVTCRLTMLALRPCLVL